MDVQVGACATWTGRTLHPERNLGIAAARVLEVQLAAVEHDIFHGDDATVHLEPTLDLGEVGSIGVHGQNAGLDEKARRVGRGVGRSGDGHRTVDRLRDCAHVGTIIGKARGRIRGNELKADAVPVHPTQLYQP